MLYICSGESLQPSSFIGLAFIFLSRGSNHMPSSAHAPVASRENAASVQRIFFISFGINIQPNANIAFFYREKRFSSSSLTWKLVRCHGV